MRKLIYSSVQFDGVAHSYTLDGNDLQGITGMIGRQLFPNKYGDVDFEILEAARVRGKNAHQAIEIFDKFGMITDGFSELIANYTQFKKDNEIDVLENEYIVTDNHSFATPIDMVDADFNIYDWKFTYEVDKSYLQWQLSIVSYLFEIQNGFAPNKCFGVHVDKNWNFTKIEITPIGKDKIIDLLDCEIDGVNYTDISLINVDFSTLIELEDTLTTFKEKMAEIEAKKAYLCDIIKTQMEQNGIKSWEVGGLKITIVAESESITIDSTKLKKDYPEIAKECSKKSQRKGYLKITTKN